MVTQQERALAVMRILVVDKQCEPHLSPSIRFPRRFLIDGTTRYVTQRVRPNHRAESR